MTTGTKTYPYKTRAEKIGTLLAGTAALATYGAGLACIFNPAALGLVLSASLASALTTQYDFSEMITRRKTPPFFGVSGMTPLTRENACADHNAVDLLNAVDDVSDRMGINPPPVYVASPDAVAQMLLPAGLRWAMKIRPIRSRIMSNVFGAEPEMGALIVTREGLKSGHPPRSLRFIVAHEMAHLKTDRRDFAYLAGLILKGATQTLFWGCVGMAGFAALGLPIPLAGPEVGLVGLPAAGPLLMPFLAGGALLATWLAGDVFTSYASRVRERRADRNALYVTRDLAAAEAVLNHIHAAREPEKHDPLIMELCSTHPSHKRRAEALRQAFCQVNCYPAPIAAGANDNAKINGASLAATGWGRKRPGGPLV